RARETTHAGQPIERAHYKVASLLEGLVHPCDAALVPVERRGRRLLRDARSIGGRLALDRGHGGDELLRTTAVADAPPSHGVRFGHSIDGDRAGVELRNRSQKTAEGLR